VPTAEAGRPAHIERPEATFAAHLDARAGAGSVSA
jgi:hypothetical protein